MVPVQERSISGTAVVIQRRFILRVLPLVDLAPAPTLGNDRVACSVTGSPPFVLPEIVWTEVAADGGLALTPELAPVGHDTDKGAAEVGAGMAGWDAGGIRDGHPAGIPLTGLWGSHSPTGHPEVLPADPSRCISSLPPGGPRF